MSDRIITMLRLFILNLLCFVLIACGGGDSKIVSLPDEPEEEEVIPLIVKGAAVKGPLANAEIKFYKVDLENDQLLQQGYATKAFYRLLSELGIDVQDGVVTVTSGTESQALLDLKSEINKLGFVGELARLQSGVDSLSSVADVEQALACDYLGEGGNSCNPIETNALLHARVKAVYDEFATVPSLKGQLIDLETLYDEIAESGSITEGERIIRAYRNAETDESKVNAWLALIGEGAVLSSLGLSLNDIKATASSVGTIRADIDAISFNASADAIAVKHYQELKDELRTVSTVESSIQVLDEFIANEGNASLRADVIEVREGIVSVETLIELIGQAQALYSLDEMADILETETELQSFYDRISIALQQKLEQGLADAFVSPELEPKEQPTTPDRPVNLVTTQISNSAAHITGADLGDYEGFVYMHASASSDTVDLNAGTSPLIPELYSVFHTDLITGRRNNLAEDERIYFIANGQPVRYEDGSLISKQEDIPEDVSGEITTIQPYRFASPLSTLGVDLLSDIILEYQRTQADINGDAIADLMVDADVLQAAMSQASSRVVQAFGVGLDHQNTIFDAPAMITPAMQFQTELQSTAALYRASIESFSAFVQKLKELTHGNTSSLTLMAAIHRDLSDGEIDGKDGDMRISLFEDIVDIAFWAKQNPAEVNIPGTNVKIDKVDYFLRQEVANIEQTFDMSSYALSGASLGLVSPAGGIDSDGDGVLDNSDAAPLDPDVTRDLPAGYAGLAYINLQYDDADDSKDGLPYLASLSGEFRFDAFVQETLTTCSPAPCISIGNNATVVDDQWQVLQAPEHHDLEITELNDDVIVGFVAKASVPGDYLIQATLKTDIEPAQEFRTTIPLRVINPRDIEIRFSPSEPEAGQMVSAQFKVTDDLCRLYDICSLLNRSDDVDDYLDISVLSEFFQVSYQVESSSESSNRIVQSQILDSSINQTQVVNEISTSVGDRLELTVHFNSGEDEFVSGEYSSLVGLNGDSDGDGVVNKNDAFPDDPLCSALNEGVLDLDGDGESDSNGGACSQTLLNSVSDPSVLLSHAVDFANEVWTYSSELDFIIRRYESSGQLRQPIPLFYSGVSRHISSLYNHALSKRVYLVNEDQSVSYFSLETDTLKPFVASRSGLAVDSISFTDEFVLLSYRDGSNNLSYFLVDQEANSAEFAFDTTYPEPGEEITLKLSGKTASSLSSLLSFEWELNRDGQLGSVTTSSDNLTILAGETEFGDVLTLTVSLKGTPDQIIDQHEFVFLGASNFQFDDKNYNVDRSISIIAPGLDLSSPLATQRLYVNWYRNGVEERDYRFISKDKTFPYSLSASNTNYGDFIKAEVYLLSGGEELQVSSLETLVLGDVSQFTPAIEINPQENVSVDNLEIKLKAGTRNDQFFNQSIFTPIWYVNGDAVREGGFSFPGDFDIDLAYGDLIQVEFEFEFNGIVLTSGLTRVVEIQPDLGTSEFSLFPAVPIVSEDVTLHPKDFTEEALSEFQAKWIINGMYDASVKAFTYPAEKLQFGDKVELGIEESSGFVSRSFEYVASTYVGLDFFDALDSDKRPDEDGDSVRNKDDYFRNDASCYAQQDGNPDDIDGDKRVDLDEILSASPSVPGQKDSDGDGLSDLDEITAGSKASFIQNNTTDDDSDLLPDYFEQLLSDISSHTGNLDNSNDPVVIDATSYNATALDSDGDRILNYFEIFIGSDPNDPEDPVLPDSDFYETLTIDSDLDGFSDGIELLLGSNPNNILSPISTDTDGDGLSDFTEFKIGSSLIDPVDPISWNDRILKRKDSDQDGLFDDQEVQLGTFVYRQDSDLDGLLDGYEVANGLDPLNPDMDGDYLSDGVELNVTGTSPTDMDSDDDGLSDGVEVIVLGFDPNDIDTDDNRIIDFLDAETTSLTATQRKIIYEADLVGYIYANKPDMVPSGTCYSTWIGEQNDVRIAIASADQNVVSTIQEVAFSAYDWPEILRYDAINKTYLPPISQSVTRGNISALEYSVSNPLMIYLGYPNGEIRTFDTSLASDPAAESVARFNVGWEGEILDIIDQGNVLLVETSNPYGDGFIHYVFDNVDDATPIGLIEKVASSVSYRNHIWKDSNRNELFFYDVNDDGRFTLLKETFDASVPPEVTSSVIFTEESSLIHGPAFIDQTGAEEFVRFGSGHRFNIARSVMDFSQPLYFEQGLVHQGHQAFVSPRSEQLTLQLKESTFQWSLTQQISNRRAISIVPVAEDILVISADDQDLAPAALSFDYFSVGDSDGDGLHGWWEALAGSDDSIIDNGATVPNASVSYQQLFDLSLYSIDNDSDGDGIADIDELSDAQRFDYLGSGTDDADADGDGLTDAQEKFLTHTNPANVDSDNDGVLDADEDQDGDGLTALEEASYSSSDLKVDTDGDGVSDYEEVNNANPSNPIKVDSDEDGLTDFQELQITFTNPNVADSDTNGTADGAEDFDSDLLTNSQELNVYLTAHDNADTDGDTISDYDEVNGTNGYVTNPLKYDTDNDGLSDAEEVASGSHPLLEDGDFDGLSDAYEIANGSDPLNSDSDSDGLSDAQELDLDTDPLIADSDGDGDGLTNLEEISVTFTDPASNDSDGDGILDGDEDRDRDGLSDLIELRLSGDGYDYEFDNYDSDGDGIFDGDEDADGDTLTNKQEILMTLTDPGLVDTDGDLISDALDDQDSDQLTNFDELNITQTDPNNADTDGDGIDDGSEDSDADGLPNRVELTVGVTFDGCSAGSITTSVIINPLAVDTDADGIKDFDEYCLTGTNPQNANTDGDGLLDGEEDDESGSGGQIGDGLTIAHELYITGTDFSLYDTNANGVSDGDEDNDGDGLTNAQELNITLTDPNTIDSDLDGISDADEDRDGDGLSDFEELNLGVDGYLTSFDDADSDNDGLNDSTEVTLTGTSPVSIDTDGDGTNDGDEDRDGDGVSDRKEINEYLTQFDISEVGLDSDNDGVENLDEVNNGTQIFSADSDRDGLTDGEEAGLGTDPLDKDSDEDGLTDFEEVRVYLSNPNGLDSDNDGIDDGIEVKTHRTSPVLIDTDGDNLSDYQEIEYTETNPLLVDSDEDGVLDNLEDLDVDKLSNFDELNYTSTDPLIADTNANGTIDGNEDIDSDALTNAQELNLTATLVNDVDSDNDGILDGDEDRDGDGVGDARELNVILTDWLTVDTDGDGLSDGQEDLQTQTSPKLVDTDDDGILDPDEDSDNDGLTNIQELEITMTNPLVEDHDGDGTVDGDEDTDGDGLTDAQELNQTFTDITLANSDGIGPNDGDEDPDGDGLSNLEELNAGLDGYITDTQNSDTDGDGVSDSEEVNLGVDGYITNPNDSDSDNDGLDDGVEVLLGTNPNTQDSDGNGTSDANENFDNDGLTNYQEAVVTGTDPMEPDSNGNGVNDGDEDTDNDGLSDSIELNITLSAHNISNSQNPAFTDADNDFDQDGIGNLDELLITSTDPRKADSTDPVNGVNDGDEDLDGDGLTAAQEIYVTLTDITLNDTDGDGVNDGDEDADNDGLSDAQELNFTLTQFDNANTFDNDINDAQFDNDNDGLSNLDELTKTLTNPLLEDSDDPVNGVSDAHEDFDGDGLTNAQELYDTNTNPLLADSNDPVNGINDGDEDTDGDGLSDAIELNQTFTSIHQLDSDLNGVVDGDEDFDADGLSNLEEVQLYGTRPDEVDSDQDGLSDFEEVNDGDDGYITSPVNRDSDGDGFTDGQEFSSGRNPTTPDSDVDSDGDGLTDGEEYNLTKTSPVVADSNSDGITDDKEDSDGDGLLNLEELRLTGTDPLNQDSDGDGIVDGAEDSDLDGISDADELYHFGDPDPNGVDPYYLNPDVNANSILDGDDDDDGDQLTNRVEFNQTSTLYNNSDSDSNGITDDQEDSDGDGIPNIDEINITLTNPGLFDTDGDGTPDGGEDIDGDGLSYVHETYWTNTLIDNPDSDGDSLSDRDEDPDMDNLTNKQEIYDLGTHPLNSDSDGNGLNDDVDDLDGDGLSNLEELTLGGDGYITDPLNADTDSDGIDDFEEVVVGVDGYLSKPDDADSDNDGLSDFEEVTGFYGYVSDPMDSDTDNDGRSDSYEVKPGLDGNGTGYVSDPNLVDTDNDGLSDDLEYVYKTNPAAVDTDSDGLTDDQEINITGTDPKLEDTDANSLSDGLEDPDEDGLTNLQELALIGQVVANVDSDGDGTDDVAEFLINNPDSDDDGILDGEEDEESAGAGDGLSVLQEVEYGSSVWLSDTDSDGLSDLEEFNYSFTYASDHNETFGHFENFEHDTKADPTLVDTDGDGLDDLIERDITLTNLAEADTDEDGLSDYEEYTLTLTDPLVGDTDFDGILDGSEDTDGDGLTDYQELNLTNTSHTDPDSDLNGVSDGEEDPDGDGLLNLQEVVIGTCPITGVMGGCLQPHDSDGDGLTDFDEFYGTTSPLIADTDGDGLTDFEEQGLSDPTIVDSDFDGLNDLSEINAGSNPYLADSDSDGLSDFAEYEYVYEFGDKFVERLQHELISKYRSGLELPYGFNIVLLDETDEEELLDKVNEAILTLPYHSDPLKVDTDNDGLTDKEEVSLNTNTALSDTDNDGISDFDEVNASFSKVGCVISQVYVTSPVAEDTDGDGILDGDEYCITQTDPTDQDSDDDGILDGDEDSDQDGLTDAQELYSTYTDIASPENISDASIDSDNDGLTNSYEVSVGLDPRNPDTDGDGILDGDEVLGLSPSNPFEADSDNDGLTDQEEILLMTNVMVSDSDGDGLSDGEEAAIDTNPLDPDSDHDFLLDGEDDAPLNHDLDGDGLIDGIEELYLNLDLNLGDTDDDGVLDNHEVWVYAYINDQNPVVVGVDYDVVLNSHVNDSGWEPALGLDFDADGIEFVKRALPEWNVLNPDSDATATLYIRYFSKPDVKDSDADGLEDGTELLLIESSFGSGIDITESDISFDPHLPNTALFTVSDPLSSDTDGDGVVDGFEDADGDFYVNYLEQIDKKTDITDANTDATLSGIDDGLPDGIEKLVMGSDPSVLDTDEDGVNDQDELHRLADDPNTAELEPEYYHATPMAGDSCTPDQYLIQNVAGTDYCITVKYKSYPTLVDSDNDGVFDGEDSFGLDENCSLRSDGFKTDIADPSSLICFSSWLAQQDNFEQIVHGRWADADAGAPSQVAENQEQVSVFSSGWERVIRYDVRSERYLPPLKLGDVEFITYAPHQARLYYFDPVTSRVKYFDLNSVDFIADPDRLTTLNASDMDLNSEAEDLVSLSLVDVTLDAIVSIGDHLFIQLVNGAGEFSYQVVDSQGLVNTDLPGSGFTDFNVKDGLWDAESGRLYGFRGLERLELGYISIDTLKGSIESAPVYSGDLGVGALSGPMSTSEDGGTLLLGDRYAIDIDLTGGLIVIAQDYFDQTLSGFSFMQELAGHFVGIVDVDPATQALSSQSEFNNGLYVRDQVSEPGNQYLFKPVTETEQILGVYQSLGERVWDGMNNEIIPSAPEDILYIRKDERSFNFEWLGLKDKDQDGMSGIYESFYGLDDQDDQDRYDDVDGDFLSNLEEYHLATDPTEEDTDGDNWSDSYEVLNGTDPRDRTSF